jgi:hypothetical protein
MVPQRITISLPEYLVKQIKERANGNISKYFQQLVKKDILSKAPVEKTPKEAFDDLMLLRESSPKYSTEELIEFIHKGRK